MDTLKVKSREKARQETNPRALTLQEQGVMEGQTGSGKAGKALTLKQQAQGGSALWPETFS